MAASPHRPAQPVGGIGSGLSDQCGVQVLDLVAGQPDQPGRWWVAGVFGHGRHHQEGMGEHRQRDPPVPGAPAAHLMLVQATQALTSLQALLDGPAPARDPHQDGQGRRAGRVAAVEGQLAGPLVAADHEPMLAGLAARRSLAIEAEERPVVVAVALGAPAGRHALPCPRWDMGDQGVGGAGGATEADRVVAGHRRHVADASALQLGPQLGVGAVDLVTGDPGRRDPGVQRTADHLGGQGRLGHKPDLIGDAGGPAPLSIVGPGAGQVQLPVDHRVPRLAGVHQVDGDLGVLDAARGAGDAPMVCQARL